MFAWDCGQNSQLRFQKNNFDTNPKKTNLVIMKVKVGQLKAHLSRYLKDVRDTGDPIEVCVREDTVAYLTPSRKSQAGSTVLPDPELARQLAADGLNITYWGRKSSLAPTPGRCANPVKGANSVESIRAEKNW